MTDRRDLRRERNRRYRTRQRSGAAYTAGDLLQTPRDDLAQAVTNRTCPWCSSGPFVNPGNHWFQAHGVTAREMKRHLEIPLDVPLVEEWLSELLSDEQRVRMQDPEYRKFVAEMLEIGGVAARATPQTPLQEHQRRAGSALAKALFSVPHHRREEAIAMLTAIASSDRSSSGE